MSFHEHGILLYLSKELYTAFIKLQADKGLGRSYAGLLPLVEGLYHMGYLSKEVYEEHVKKYSQPLTELKPLTPQQLKEREEISALEKHYLGVVDQWPTLDEKARDVHGKRAEEVADRVPSANLVLALASGEFKFLDHALEVGENILDDNEFAWARFFVWGELIRKAYPNLEELRNKVRLLGMKAVEKSQV